MRKAFGALIAVALVAVLIAGCGGGKPADSTKTPIDVPGSVTEKEAVETTMEVLEKDQWPAHLAPPGMPEWPGKVLNWIDLGGALDVDLADVTEENLAAYFDALEAAGWTVFRSGLEGMAYKGMSDAVFYEQGDGVVLLEIVTYQAGTWPSRELPPEIHPPEDCVLVGDPWVRDEEGGEWYSFEFTCEGMDEAAAEAYLLGLQQEGWEGPGQFVKEVRWKSKTWQAAIWLNDIYATRCNFYGHLAPPQH